MDETYRMLGREHEADLGREAARGHLAAELARSRRLGRRPALKAPADGLRRLLLELRGGRAAPALHVRRR